MPRKRWSVTVERDSENGDSNHPHFLIRWAIVGLAVVGLLGVAVWRLTT